MVLDEVEGFKSREHDIERTHSEQQKSSLSPGGSRRRKRGLSRTKSTLNKKFKLSQRKKKEKIRKSKSFPSSPTSPPHSPSSKKSNRKRHLQRIKSGVAHSRDKKKLYRYHREEQNSRDWEIGHAPGLLLETLIDPKYSDVEPTAQTFKAVLKPIQKHNATFFFCLDDTRSNVSYIFCTVDSETRHEWVSALRSFSCSQDDGEILLTGTGPL